MKKFCYIVILWMTLMCLPVSAKLTVPPVISSHMVLQQGEKCPLWGTAEPGEKITVIFAGQTRSAVADVLGRWTVELTPMKASPEPGVLTIKGQTETMRLTDVVVGEVWLCSGQSNMQYSLRRFKTFAAPRKGEDLGAAELKKPENRMLRVFLSDRAQSWNGWQTASGKSLPDITAAGYFFGKEIQQRTGIPVGIVSAALGGQRIETWTPVEAYNTDSVFRKQLRRTSKIDGLEPGQWYNHLIRPLVPFAFRGVVWYQGENNCAVGERHYAEKYKVLVDCWRKAFRRADLPFYCVLLAPHTYSKGKPVRGHAFSTEELPNFWMQQLKGVAAVPDDGIICISDLVDDPADIHPPYKWEVGRRLPGLALLKTYGVKTGIGLNPVLLSARRKGTDVLLTFSNCGKGLKTSDGLAPDWFEVAGADGVFHPAKATIVSAAVVELKVGDVISPLENKPGGTSSSVSSSEKGSPRPLQIRFGWNEAAMPNLVSAEGLPAFPFGAQIVK